jgi:hypothetical protein
MRRKPLPLGVSPSLVKRLVLVVIGATLIILPAVAVLLFWAPDRGTRWQHEWARKTQKEKTAA